MLNQSMCIHCDEAYLLKTSDVEAGEQVMLKGDIFFPKSFHVKSSEEDGS